MKPMNGSRRALRSPGTSEFPGCPSPRCLRSSKIVKFVIGAEFDNKIGSVIKHQIPRKIPGFKDNLNGLAELMIPLNTEKSSEDYTIFLLYRNSSDKYQLFPDSDKEVYGSEVAGIQTMNIHEISTIYEAQRHDSLEEEENSSDEGIDDFLFFLNVSKTVASDDDERGIKIKSIAIGTPLRNFIIFKHLITITIQSYIQDGSIAHLIALFNVINSTDISLWLRFMALNPHLHKNLSLSYEFNNRLILSNFKNIPTNGITTQSVKYKNGVLQYFSSFETEDPIASRLKLIPLNFSLSVSNTEISTDLNFSSKILTFFNHLSAKLNQIEYKNFNIMIYSNNLINSTDLLCQFVLAISNFFSGFDNPYFSNDKILYFPLIDLTNWETLLKYSEHSKNTKIIGTNNIVLKDHDTFYDFWYDLDKEMIELSPRVSVYDDKLILNKTFHFRELLNELKNKKHDSNTVLVSLKKFNIWQILKILKRDLQMEEEKEGLELNIQDYYLSENKNLVLFNEFFEFKTIELIERLDQLVSISSNPRITSNDIKQLISILKFFIQFVSISDPNIGTFLFILEIFPGQDTSDSNGSNLLFDVESIQSNRTQESLINQILKLILIGNTELQKNVYQLFDIFKKSAFKLIIDERINVFTRALIDEYSETYKNTISKDKPKNIKMKRSKTSLDNNVNHLRNTGGGVI